MKIADHYIQQKSTYQMQQVKITEETLRINGRGGAFTPGRNSEEPAAVLQLSPDSLQQMAADLSSATNKATGDSYDDEKRIGDIKLRMIEAMVYLLTGKRIQLRRPDIDLDKGSQPSLATAGFGFSYDYHEITFESESVNYEANGFVTTEDGRQYSFAVQMNMNRVFYQEKNFQVRVGTAVDPLVLSLDGQAPKLSQNKYAFDLNNDGIAENISFAIDGSGFLALDKNGDGEINNGSELFGPGTGDGFMELAMYDLDNNGWIDENDDVFSKLSVLTMSEDGEKTLFKLGELGIGAIYLNAIDSPFTFKDQEEEHGKMRSTSVFLRENGAAGTIHHIDLTL